MDAKEMFRGHEVLSRPMRCFAALSGSDRSPPTLRSYASWIFVALLDNGGLELLLYSFSPACCILLRQWHECLR